jgi:hypothetical protein
MTERTLFNGLSDTGGWVLDVELDELPLLDRAGQPFVIARVPRIVRRFTSAMHTPAGMTPRLGNWRDELAAFLAGQLPSARLSEETSLDSERAELRAAVIRAIQEGFAGSLKVDAEGEVYGYLARPDRIAATIDVDALAADYEAWFAAAGVVAAELGDDAAEISEQLGWEIEDLRERCYSDYLHSLGEERYRAGGRVRGAVVDGIVVGDDPAQTCAFLLRELTGDQRLWESVR